MKKQFFDIMLKLMEENKDIYLIFVGLGYPRFEEFKQKFPDRAINTEAAEATALDISVGLSYSGKIPVVYTITPFYWRAAETIRVYFNHERLSCVLIGAGVNEEYGIEDGFSHSATDIGQLFDLFENFEQRYPDNEAMLKDAIIEAIKSKSPTFINIHR